MTFKSDVIKYTHKEAYRMKMNNFNSPVWSIYTRFLKGELKIPTHQELRGDIWSSDKKKRWWKDIQSNKGIPGVIITYQLAAKNGPNDPVYINDGANRVIHSIRSLVEELRSKGVSDY